MAVTFEASTVPLVESLFSPVTLKKSNPVTASPTTAVLETLTSRESLTFSAVLVVKLAPVKEESSTSRPSNTETSPPKSPPVS